MPPPTTELMFTWKSACSASSCSFLSSTFRLFFETSSGLTLSMEICMCSRPGAIQPLDPVRRQQVAVGDHARDGAVAADADDQVIEFGMQQRLAAADGDDGGAEIGQLVDAPKHFGTGTGFEKSSYSLQYVQERLQRRVGTIWASTGWSVERMPLASISHSRGLRRRSAQSSSEAGSECRHRKAKALLQHTLRVCHPLTRGENNGRNSANPGGRHRE